MGEWQVESELAPNFGAVEHRIRTKLIASTLVQWLGTAGSIYHWPTCKLAVGRNIRLHLVGFLAYN